MLARIVRIANISLAVRCKIEGVCTRRTFGNARGYLRPATSSSLGDLLAQIRSSAFGAQAGV